MSHIHLGSRAGALRIGPWPAQVRGSRRIFAPYWRKQGVAASGQLHCISAVSPAESLAAFGTVMNVSMCWRVWRVDAGDRQSADGL
ncbi:MAG: hypothetical protein ACU85V_02930 [Gammaproteobacteria bacterium]